MKVLLQNKRQDSCHSVQTYHVALEISALRNGLEQLFCSDLLRIL